ncbi:DUF7344 domain-containing protein [Haloferax elongans]
MRSELTNFIRRLREITAPSTHDQTSQPYATDIEYSDVLNLLTSDRRRWVIQLLASEPTGETIPLSKLAEQVAAKENNCSVSELTSQQRKRVYISLQQQHMPQLNGVVVEYDSNRQVVVPTEAQRVWDAFKAFQIELSR